MVHERPGDFGTLSGLREAPESSPFLSSALSEPHRELWTWAGLWGEDGSSLKGGDLARERALS
jgi:hypothetical protein